MAQRGGPQDRRVRSRHEILVTQLPASQQAWMLGEESLEVQGPFPAVAVATKCEVFAWDVQTVRLEAQGTRGTPEIGARDDTSLGLDNPLDYAEVNVLLLMPDFGGLESPWIPRQRVFFSEAAAREASRRMRGQE